jgi:hypothetical protein
MMRTVFSATLVTAAVVVLGAFENGDGLPGVPAEAWTARNEALTRAKVFRNEPFDATKIDFSADPNFGVVDPALTICRYKPEETSGTTPKFDCELPDGEVIKVKYGWTDEIPSEVASTRLLHAMGFGADRVSRTHRVRCYGCPFQPFHTRSLAEFLGLESFLDRHLDYARHRDFTHVSAERNIEGTAIEVGRERGWAFHELKNIDPARGGASPAEVDALRLIAVFLHHWDNKTSNQRLICLDSETADCTNPLAMIQDGGSDFGPRKVDLDEWRSRAVWSGDPSECLLSMRGVPYNGGTFEDVRISDEGRRLLGGRLRQIPREQIVALFTVAGFESVPEWVSAFEDKVGQVVNRRPCPSTTTS